MGADKKSGLSFPNYSEIARAHKINYIKIKNHKNLKNQIKNILKNKNSIICELIMNVRNKFQKLLIEEILQEEVFQLNLKTCIHSCQERN